MTQDIKITPIRGKMPKALGRRGGSNGKPGPILSAARLLAPGKAFFVSGRNNDMVHNSINQARYGGRLGRDVHVYMAMNGRTVVYRDAATNNKKKER